MHKEGPTLAEKLGKDSLTAAELKTGLLKAATSMSTTSGKLADAGEALSVVSDHLVKARTERASMKPLVEPTPYTEPSYNGAQPTPEQIEKAAIDRAAANKERSDYQTAANGQEADAAAITSKLDQVFLSAIPPMMAIHGGPDPTAPTDPSTPDNPGGPKTSTPPTIPVRNDETRTGVEREPETGSSATATRSASARNANASASVVSRSVVNARSATAGAPRAGASSARGARTTGSSRA